MNRNPTHATAHRRAWRREAGWSLVATGLVLALVGVFTHLDRWQRVGWRDLVLGYPMAALLVLAGSLLIAIATQHGPPPSR